jgi:hypothetical protein
MLRGRRFLFAPSQIDRSTDDKTRHARWSWTVIAAMLAAGVALLPRAQSELAPPRAGRPSNMFMDEVGLETARGRLVIARLRKWPNYLKPRKDAAGPADREGPTSSGSTERLPEWQQRVATASASKEPESAGPASETVAAPTGFERLCTIGFRGITPTRWQPRPRATTPRDRRG